MPQSKDAQTLDTRRGRRAPSPLRIPPKGWKDVLLRVKNEAKRDNVPVLAAGMAFYAMLAIFPALIAMVSLYGLIADPADVQQQMNALAGMLPESARELLSERLNVLVTSSSASLGIGLIVSVVLALWTASAGMKAAMTAINVAYDQKEERGFVKLRGLALLFTLGAIVVVLLVFALVAVLPALFGVVGLGETGQAVVRYGRWPLMAAAVMGSLSVLYRLAPCRDNPKWRWVGSGAVVATLLWLGVTGLFSLYVSNFGSYNETYGALGGVIVLMLWLFLSSFVVLLGAELNSEIEHQTTLDTTVGDPEPIGERGADEADTVGRAFRPSET